MDTAFDWDKVGSLIPVPWLKGCIKLMNKEACTSTQRPYLSSTVDLTKYNDHLLPGGTHKRQFQFNWMGDFKRVELTPRLWECAHWIRIRCSSMTSPPDPGCLRYLTPRKWVQAVTDGLEPITLLMMQRDTPREGGRRDWSRAWTQTAPGAKTQMLLLMAASPASLQKRKSCQH